MTATQFSEKNITSVIYPAFRRHLESLHISDRSIRNYKSDFDHFVRWLIVSLPRTEMLDKVILTLDENTINSYKQFLLSSQTPRLTINRRLTSIRHLATYLLGHNYIGADFSKSIKNVGSNKIATRPIEPFYGPQAFAANTNTKRTKPAIPVLISTAAVILMLLQIILTERPTSPWSNVIAKQGENIATTQIEHLAIDNTYTWEDKQISIRLNPDNKDVFLAAKPVLIDEKQIILEMTSELDLQKTTSGRGVVNVGTNGTIIYNDLVTADSIINITPTSSTANQIIYIKKQEEGMFIVGFDEIVIKKVNFNWDIVID